jgi:glycosyltransferase involved in cell wall biosynthesis
VKIFHIRIVHIITTLDYGGAENMLFKLVSSTATNPNYQQMVISLTDKGGFGPLLEKQGIRVHAVGLNKRCANALKTAELISQIKIFKPHILQSWLYHADLVGTFLFKFARGAKLVWNIRCSDMNFKKYTWTTRLIFLILQKFSGIPSAVCANSQAGILAHQKKGYHPKKWIWIPNGFDTQRFKPQPKGDALRKQLGIPLSSPVIGMVARFDPMKDFDTFFRAASIVRTIYGCVHFVLIGSKVDTDNPYLCRLINSYQLNKVVHMLGRRNDVDNIYPQMDIFSLSSSFGEGFPNVIGEAMASGVPCVATDVGDSKLIIGDTGITVPAKDPNKLAGAWLSLLSAPEEMRFQMGRAARQSIVDKYRLEVVQKKYLSLYNALALQKAD